MAKWVKGQSGNPGGRKKLPEDVVGLARKHTVDAMQVLADILLHSDHDPSRVRAAEILLNRGWGTAPQVVQIDGEIAHVKRIVFEGEA